LPREFRASWDLLRDCYELFLNFRLGGSKTQIGGPTGAFVVVVLGIFSKYGLDGLFTCTMLAGLILVIMGATGWAEW